VVAGEPSVDDSLRVLDLAVPDEVNGDGHEDKGRLKNMADILLFGATGYTGKLTAAALAARGADFVVAGRNPAKLDRLAAGTGAGSAPG
jgi:hypothetical protein